MVTAGLNPPDVAPAPPALIARYLPMPSTAIDRFEYRPALGALDVRFVGGRVYRYFEVPEEVAGGLARAGSRGGYFNRAIRDRYRFERLPRWDDDGEGAQPREPA